MIERDRNALRVLAAAQAHEIVRREAIGCQRRADQFERDNRSASLAAERQRLHALRDREADLLEIIAETQF